MKIKVKGGISIALTLGSAGARDAPSRGAAQSAGIGIIEHDCICIASAAIALRDREVTRSSDRVDSAIATSYGTHQLAL